MNVIRIAVTAALLLQGLTVPCLAHEVSLMTSEKAAADGLTVGVYVIVVHTSRISKGKTTETWGLVRTVDRDGFVVDGPGFWLETIGFRDVVSLKVVSTERHPLKFLRDHHLEAGQGVRIHSPSFSQSQVTGRVFGAYADTLLLVASNGVRVRLPLTSVVMLEVARNRSRTLIGAVVGLMAGLCTGGIVGATHPYSPWFSAQEKVEMAGFLGGVGLALGAGIGWSISGRSWQAVPIEEFRASLAPQRQRGLTLAAAFEF